MATLIILISYPIASQLFLYKNRANLNKESFQKKFHAAYLLQRTDNSRFLVYQPLSLYRRLLIPLLVIFNSDSLLIQFWWIQITSGAITCFVFLKQPFTSSWLNTGVAVEELTIQVLTYHILCFTDLVPDVETIHSLAMSFISVILAILVVNYAG